MLPEGPDYLLKLHAYKLHMQGRSSTKSVCCSISSAHSPDLGLGSGPSVSSAGRDNNNCLCWAALRMQLWSVAGTPTPRTATWALTEGRPCPRRSWQGLWPWCDSTSQRAGTLQAPRRQPLPTPLQEPCSRLWSWVRARMLHKLIVLCAVLGTINVHTPADLEVASHCWPAPSSLWTVMLAGPQTVLVLFVCLAEPSA